MKLSRTFTSSLLCCGLTAAGFAGCTGCAPGAPRCAAPEQVTLFVAGENRVVTLGLSEYLTGCIFACADPSFQPEALLAAGIALCGQTMYCLDSCDRSGNFGADLCSRGGIYPDWLSPEELEERYADRYPEWLDRVSGAAEEAASLCLFYDGKPAFTPCCRVSSGLTEDGGQPYLPAMKLERDFQSPDYSGNVEYTCDTVRSLLAPLTGSVILPPDREEWFTGAEYTQSGSLSSVKFGGAEISGGDMSRALGLRSSVLTFRQEYDSFVFETRGFGGNTGMSMYTAELLARSGMTAEEILQQFFPGTELAGI